MNVREGMRRLGILLGICGAVLGAYLSYSGANSLWESRHAHRRFESLMASPALQNVTKAVHDYLKPDKFGGIRVVESQTLIYADNGTIREDVPIYLDDNGNPINTARKKDPNAEFGGHAAQEHPDLSKLTDEQLEVYRDLLAKKEARPAPAGKSRFGGIPIEEKTKTRVTQFGDPVIEESQHSVKPDTLPRDFFASQGNILVSVNVAGVKWIEADNTGQVLSIQPDAGAWIDRTVVPLTAYIILLYPALGFLLPWGAVRVLTWVGTGFFVEVRK